MRELAIGDIHGCLTALDTVLKAAAPQPDDLIITLGDYVDRGPETRGVIDRLLEIDRTGRLIPLRGNHELMMIEARDKDALEFWKMIGGQETLASYAADGGDGRLDNVPLEHWEFIEDRCVDWRETDTHLFVHAGVDPNLPLQEQSEMHLFWEKLGDPGPHVSGKTVICGHTAQPSGEPRNLGHIVCIDTWVYGNGWLTCLEVATGRYWQATQNGDLREGRLEEK